MPIHQLFMYEPMKNNLEVLALTPTRIPIFWMNTYIICRIKHQLSEIQVSSSDIDVHFWYKLDIGLQCMPTLCLEKDELITGFGHGLFTSSFLLAYRCFYEQDLMEAFLISLFHVVLSALMNFIILPICYSPPPSITAQFKFILQFVSSTHPSLPQLC